MKSSETTAKENKIRDTLSFLNEEEAILSLYETEEKMLRFFVYPMGEGMAEVTAQDMGLLSRNQKIEEMSGKITEKMTKKCTNYVGYGNIRCKFTLVMVITDVNL